MIRYAMLLPESGYRMTGVAESSERLELLNQLGWKRRSVGQAEVERRSPQPGTHLRAHREIGYLTRSDIDRQTPQIGVRPERAASSMA